MGHAAPLEIPVEKFVVAYHWLDKSRVTAWCLPTISAPRFLAINPLPTSDFQVIDIAGSGLGLKSRLAVNWPAALGRMPAWKGIFQALSSLLIVGAVQGPQRGSTCFPNGDLGCHFARRCPRIAFCCRVVGVPQARDGCPRAATRAAPTTRFFHTFVTAG